MNQEIKKRWVEALRSGEYKQGQECLRQKTNDGLAYCCMGVLCDVLKDEVELRWRIRSGEVFTAVTSTDSLEGFLPKEVAKAAGLPSPNPFVKIGTEEVSLARINDRLGLSFTEIADLIEAQL